MAERGLAIDVSASSDEEAPVGKLLKRSSSSAFGELDDKAPLGKALKMLAIDVSPSSDEEAPVGKLLKRSSSSAFGELDDEAPPGKQLKMLEGEAAPALPITVTCAAGSKVVDDADNRITAAASLAQHFPATSSSNVREHPTALAMWLSVFGIKGGIEEGERLNKLLDQFVTSAADSNMVLELRRKGRSPKQKATWKANNVEARKYNLEHGDGGFADPGDNLVLTEPQLVQLANALGWTRDQVWSQLSAHCGRISGGAVSAHCGNLRVGSKCGALCCVCAHRAIPVCCEACTRLTRTNLVLLLCRCPAEPAALPRVSMIDVLTLCCSCCWSCSCYFKRHCP
jgi:hypothetical protein